jgi:SAM-dependent methyltransferase
MNQEAQSRTAGIPAAGTRTGWSHSLRADRFSLTLDGPPLPPDSTLSILLGGRPIWNVRTGDVARPGPGTSVIDWPPALSGRLSGWAQLAVLQDGTPLCPAASVTFDDSPHQFFLEEPRTGVPQIVNKWGRIARNFEGGRAHLIDEALEEACILVAWLRGRGYSLFVTGGTLLGPVRDGRIMPGDDDVDLAYLSPHDNPSDIALEGFELERALQEEGYETVRHSAGHLQLLFPGADGSDRFYMDIFTYFIVDGWFHGTFHARERMENVTIFPLQTLTINGRDLPAPAEPEQMLTAIYGASWRIPDPAFRFSTPSPARRRYDNWLGSLDGDRENWEDLHRALLGEEGPSRSPAPWAQELARELPPGSRILELGCGLGADARWFASQGHRAVAVDYSRPAIEGLRTVRAGSGSLDARRVNLNSLREIAPLAKLANHTPDPLYVYARLLLNSLSERGRENTLTLLGHILRNQRQPAAAFLEIQDVPAEPPFPDARFYGVVDLAALTNTLAHVGLTAADVTPQLGHHGDGPVPTRRLTVRALP